MSKELQDKLAELQKAREEQEKSIAAKAADQELTDRIAIEEIAVEKGLIDFATLKVPHCGEGFPVVCAVRVPSRSEIKRWQSQVATDSSTAPGILVGRSCLIYPELAVLDQMLAARPGLEMQLGKLALDLSTGKAEHDSKS